MQKNKSPNSSSHSEAICRGRGRRGKPASSTNSPPASALPAVLRTLHGEILLVDISNSFVKLAIAKNGRIGRVHRLTTKSLKAAQIRGIIGGRDLLGTVAASVVPKKCREVDVACGPGVCWIGPSVRLGVGIDYPNPAGIGPDRLANAAGCAAHYGVPAIVVDFGTAVTFDVISPTGNYIGGVIAPGLNAMTEYLHDRTALLPLIRLREPGSAVGHSTEGAMLSGAVHGYRGLVAEILRQIRREAFPRHRPKIVVTGGDSALIADGLPLFDAVDPLLTLKGLLVAASLNF